MPRSAEAVGPRERDFEEFVLVAAHNMREYSEGCRLVQSTDGREPMPAGSIPMQTYFSDGSRKERPRLRPYLPT